MGRLGSQDLGGFSLPLFNAVESSPDVIQGAVEGSKSGLHARE